MTKVWGPTNPLCDQVHAQKYRQRGESFREAMTRIASAMADDDAHFQAFRDCLLEMRFLPAGRIQATMGATRVTTPYNCFVSGSIEDSYTRGHGSIMARAADAADTMRLGGGIGYDFSTLRPRGDLIKTLDSQSSGAVSFIHIFDAVGLATASSGHRRGAQMAVLRVDHPDIEEFIRAKQIPGALTGFNLSVAATDEFMRAVIADAPFQLRFAKRIYREISARTLWETIMRGNYDWSEPGVLFIDAINRKNNLYYCETIAATNPCGEQPLPPYGACLLGSFNLPKYLERDSDGYWKFNFRQLFADIPHVVRAMDNIVDRARYPLHEQEQEALAKRRMGLGVTGVANCIEAMDMPYGSDQFVVQLRAMMRSIKNAVYRASAKLASEKGSFPLYERDKYLKAEFISNLSEETWELIYEHGIRNSHLLSIAPTGTISLAADNISSGIEPVYAHSVTRTIQDFSGPRLVELEDYGVRTLGIRGKTAAECTPADHLAVLIAASQLVDSAVSKTCNVPKDISWEDFKDIYLQAWKEGCKGCTTHRTGNMRGAVITTTPDEQPDVERSIELAIASCEVDPLSGRRSCE